MADWSQQMAEVDDDVDEELGDQFQFAPSAGDPFAPINGFVDPEDIIVPSSGRGALDPMGTKPRIKVNRRKIAVPSQSHRFIVPQLAQGLQVYKPENWGLSTKGRYWIIELQKV